jgi:hypothetical protein
LIDRWVDRDLAWLVAEAFVSTAVAEPDYECRETLTMKYLTERERERSWNPARDFGTF